MAKRRRLIPSAFGSEIAPVIAEGDFDGPAPEVKAFLRRPSAVLPIAQVAGDTAAQAALQELSEAMTQARAEGRLVLRLPLDKVEADHLVRDRIGLDEDELAPLIASIRDHGQRTPVEVTALPSGRYGLISGWRRMQALSRLATEDPDRFGHVLALVRRPDTAAEAYVAMVEENEIRLGLSYYERARIAARSVELGVFETEKQALQQLFATASRARRSKIGSFLTIWRHLDEVLRFPAAIPERLGLALEKALDAAGAEGVALLVADLRENPIPDLASEQARLTSFVNGKPTRQSIKTALTEPVSPISQEIRPGVFLEVGGGWLKPVLTLSGPAVGPDFREALEIWLAQGR